MTTILQPRDAQQLRECFARLRKAGRALEQLPTASVLQLLEDCSQDWLPGSPLHEQAVQRLAGAFSEKATRSALCALSASMRTEALTAAMELELGRADLLDRWAPDATQSGWSRALPLGVVAQVLAGNVFLGGVIALAQSLLTRNAVLLKLSSDEAGFTELLVRQLQQRDRDGRVGRAVAVCAWSSAEEDLNQVIRDQADAVVVWGGQAAIDAYPAARCRGKVIHHGPRIGIGVLLSGADLPAALAGLAWDVALWEQRACSSPRLLFVEGSVQRAYEVAAGLSAALQQVQSDLPARQLSLDDKAEIRTIREMAYWHQHAQIYAAARSMDHTVLVVEELPSTLPVGYRTVVIVPLPDLATLPELLAPAASTSRLTAGLQTVVLAAPPERWPEAALTLCRAGFTQVAAAGSAAARSLGLPHEGDYSLRRLIRLVGIDLGAGPLVARHRPAVEAIAASLASAVKSDRAG